LSLVLERNIRDIKSELKKKLEVLYWFFIRDSSSWNSFWLGISDIGTVCGNFYFFFFFFFFLFLKEHLSREWLADLQ